MARDKELEVERAKTRELERLLRLAEAEFRARPGNENVVRPCCSCGQTTHLSADCRVYLHLDRDASPPPPRGRCVEVGGPESGEKPRLVTAAVSGVSKRRPNKVGGRLVRPSVTAKPFKLRLDTVSETVRLRRIFNPYQLTRSAKSVALAETSRKRTAVGSAIFPLSRVMVGGTWATQPKAAESTGQPTGQAGALALTAPSGKEGAGFGSVGPGEADEPARSDLSSLSDTEAGADQRIRPDNPASSLDDSSRRATAGLAARRASVTIVGDYPATQLGAQKSTVQIRVPGGTLASTARIMKVVTGLCSDCPGKANDTGSTEVSPLRSMVVGVEAVGQTANTHLGASKSLPYHDWPYPNGFLGADATSDICGSRNPAGIAAAASSGRTQTGDAPTSDMDSDGTETPSAQAGTRPQGPPVLISVDKPSTSCDHASSVALDKLLGSPKSRRSFTALNADKLLLAGAVNRASQMRARVDNGAVESRRFAYAGGDSVERVHEKGSLLKLRLLVMRVVLALWASLTGCRGGSPGALSNAKYRCWRNNQGVDSHLEAAPD
ncbi:hypothetical protein HPB48_015819 [Haemaphysalis longicornis]|uniref:CCHC-type domain-containing protein n=1 Tax=Haemaphysalis longicornis TaxID=44386 RepID=A0A9J6F6N3_HAELO|nr:hypothetical protein HPB48_015819 [Haemaphysalis longicornis]